MKNKNDSKRRGGAAVASSAWFGRPMTLDEVKSNVPAILLPHAETVYQAMIVAELDQGGVNLPKGKGNPVPPKAGDSKEGGNPLLS